MLEVRVYHKESDEYVGSFPTDAYGNTFETVANNTEPCNYLTFDGNGINFLDNNLKFYEDGDYMGYTLPYISSENRGVNYDYAIKQTEPLIFDFSSVTQKPQNITVLCREVCIGSFKTVITRNVNGVEITLIETRLIHHSDRIVISLSEDVSKVELYFLSSLAPNQYITITSVFYGTINTFNKFTSHNLIEEINVLSDDLPIDQFEVTIVNPDPDNVVFSKKDPLTVFSNNKYYGTFYINDVQRCAKNLFDITAQNTVFLFENDLTNWNTNGFGEIAVSAVLNNLRTHTNTSIECESGIESSVITGYHKDGTCRAALCEIGYCLGKMVDGSRSNKIVLKPIPTQITSVITNNSRRIIGDALFKKTNAISAAIVNYNRIFPLDATVDEYLKKSIGGNKGDIMVISFDKPTAIITDYSSGFEIINETLTTYVVKLTATSGTVTYIERPMSDTYQTTITNTNAELENVKNFNNFLTRAEDDATFEKRNANIKKYIQSRGSVTAKIRLRGEKKGDLIQIETAWDGIITGIITKMDIKFGYEDIADIEVLEWNL